MKYEKQDQPLPGMPEEPRLCPACGCRQIKDVIGSYYCYWCD